MKHDFCIEYLLSYDYKPFTLYYMFLRKLLCHKTKFTKDLCQLLFVIYYQHFMHNCIHVKQTYFGIYSTIITVFQIDYICITNIYV
jgi:hypothetical protein